MATATNANSSKSNNPYVEDDKPSTTTTVAPSAAATDAPATAQHSTTTTDATTSNNNYNDYQQSSLTSCPPLFQLQIYGLCCPFLISEEEHDARIGVINLHNYPIIWYRKKLIRDVAVAHDVLKTIDGMIGQFFGNGGNNGGGGGGGGSGKSGDNGANTSAVASAVDATSIPMSYIGVPSTITIVDTDTHGPVIQIRSLDGFGDDDPNNNHNNAKTTAAVKEYMTNGTPWWNDDSLCNKAPDRIIPLYMVDKVASSGWNFSADGSKGGVRLYAAPTSEGGIGGFINTAAIGGGFGNELLRFDTLGGGGETVNDSLSTAAVTAEPNKYADKVIVQLKSLIDWNRRRMASDIQSGRMGVAPKGGGGGSGGNTVSGYIATKP
jgi:hypothetical protein